MRFLEHELAYRKATQSQLTRREALQRMGAGIGGIGLASMFGSSADAAQGNPLAPKAPHFAPKAKRLIQLFMPGGPSQVDTFDYKPMIAKHAGERPDCVDRKSLRNTNMGLMPSPFGFHQYCECGKFVIHPLPPFSPPLP
ncbi:MAG: DUF1501 domain-containing protein, partial [Verrucomicrobiales bacterium]